MGSESSPLHMLFFPLMAPGHMLPMVDMAKLFAARGAKATILTTPANAALIQPTVDRSNSSGRHRHPIELRLIPFPSAAVGLPDGCENLSSIPTQALQPKFLEATALLRRPVDEVLRDLLPDCVVTDSFLPWTFEVATEHGIPRLIFHGTNLFSLCAVDSVNQFNPHEALPPGTDSFVIPGLPHRIEMKLSQIPDMSKVPTSIFKQTMSQMKELDPRSYGTVANSFYELEPDYTDHYRNVMGRRVWHVGPVSMCNKDIVDKSGRGRSDGGDFESCLSWLAGRRPGSVLYACFGTLSRFTPAQLREMAVALEASGRDFVWVVKGDVKEEEWMPEKYEERVEGRGLIIRGWAPQLLILNHEAVGGFVTHCGWNSCLEGISAGLPMITWPLFAEQFYNERLIVDVLRTGVAVGVVDYPFRQDERAVVAAGVMEEAVERVMGGGEEGEERRRRAAELGSRARAAVEEGGSSYGDIGRLIEELVERRGAAGK